MSFFMLAETAYKTADSCTDSRALIIPVHVFIMSVRIMLELQITHDSGSLCTFEARVNVVIGELG